MREKGHIIQDICRALSDDNKDEARAIACREYPFVNQICSRRKITDIERTKIFIRDGFIDRYSGQKLLYPGTIMLLSHVLPDTFPYHANWKMSVSHIMFWELWPTIDHILPIARGGADEESNWVCTSMLRNSAKSNWTLEELGWQLLPSGKLEEWNGLIHWFVDYVAKHENVLENKHVNSWHKVANRCLGAT